MKTSHVHTKCRHFPNIQSIDGKKDADKNCICLKNNYTECVCGPKQEPEQ